MEGGSNHQGAYLSNSDDIHLQLIILQGFYFYYDRLVIKSLLLSHNFIDNRFLTFFC